MSCRLPRYSFSILSAFAVGCAGVSLPQTDAVFNDKTRYTYDIQNGNLQVTVVCRLNEPSYGIHLSGTLSSTDRCTGSARKIAEQIAQAGSLKADIPFFYSWKENPAFSGFNTRDGADTVSVITLTVPVQSQP